MTVVAKKLKKSTSKVSSSALSAPKKKLTHFSLRVLSRHPSVGGLRNAILVKGGRVVYRHGSTTQGDFDKEINSVQSVKNSADKLKMKQCFDNANISHARWIQLDKFKTDKAAFNAFLKEIKFPENMLIIKQRFGSRGTGNYLIKTPAELSTFTKQRMDSLNNYIVEQYKTYSTEYRIHVTATGYFYTCKKALKKDTPKEQKFQRHDDNCVWLIETNENFNKPSNWTEIVSDCIKALNAIGADVLAFDVKTTNPTKDKSGKVKWIIIESCSAPSFGEGTLAMYKLALPDVIKNKYNLQAHVR